MAADIYSTDMILTMNGRRPLHGDRAQVLHRQRQQGRLVSTFGKLAGSNDYVFFAADPSHPR